MAFKPDYLTIEDACEVLGCKPRHVLDLVATLRLRCGVISPGWDGLAMPNPSKYATNNWTDYLVETDGTRLLANKREGVSFRVNESCVIGFWFLDDGEAIGVANSKDGTTEVTWLWPEDGAIWHKKNAKCFPWPEFLYCVAKQQEAPRQIRIDDLRFRRVDVEALTAEGIDECSMDAAHPPLDLLVDPEPRVYWQKVLNREWDSIEAAHPGHGVRIPAIRHLKKLSDPRIPNMGTAEELYWFPENSDTPKLVPKDGVSKAISKLRKRKAGKNSS